MVGRALKCVGVALAFASVDATAATYLITYTGQMRNGTDVTGVFFAPNTALAGRDFTLVYTLTFPGVGRVDVNTATQLALSGGTVVGAASPISAALTLNGRTETISGSREARFERLDSANLDLINEFVEDVDTVAAFQRYASVVTTFYGRTNLLSAVAPNSAINFGTGSGLTSNARFTVLDTIQVNQVQQTVREAYGEFFVRTVTQQIADQPAVPEPATWGLMLLGFGGMGYALRRSSKVATRIRFV